MKRSIIIGGARAPRITADATVINAAFLNRHVLPQLVDEYQNDNEDFLSEFDAVPEAAIGIEGVYKNRLIDNVDALINNTVDFTGPAAHDKKSLFVPWDSVDTAPSKVTRSELRGLPYDINSRLRVRHMEALKRKTRDKLLHAVAPSANTADSPIINTGGIGYEKILAALTAIKKRGVDPRDCIMILSADHVAALATEQGAGERFRQVMFDEVSGKAKRMLGLGNVYENLALPYYDANDDLKPFGSVVTGTDKQCSLIINTKEVLFHREKMEIYYKPKNEDTRSADPGDEFRLGGYFVADTLVNKGFVALI